MKRIFKQKISPVLAFLFVLVFGYFSIFFMNEVFKKYAQDELLTKVNQLEKELAQVKIQK